MITRRMFSCYARSIFLASFCLSFSIRSDASEEPTEGKPAILSVRVMAKLHPKIALFEVRGATISCDGVALASANGAHQKTQPPLSLRAAISGDRIVIIGLSGQGRSVERAKEVNGRGCRELEIRADRVSVKVGKTGREYRGLIHVRAEQGELAIINLVELEDYLKSVVSCEQEGAGEQALAAQAVVSRTFALASLGRHKESGYDLCDLAHCQLYRGISGERRQAILAVERTEGEVLTFGSELVPIYFHSTCGGSTSSSFDIFGESFSTGQVSDSSQQNGEGPFSRALCANSPHFDWRWSVSKSRLASALNISTAGKAFEALKRDSSGRVLQVRSFGAVMSGEVFRSLVGHAFGFNKLKSLAVVAEEVGEEIHFKGKGLGHGVGLCQWGAKELDKRGKSYREILKHYFPAGRLVFRNAKTKLASPAER